MRGNGCQWTFCKIAVAIGALLLTAVRSDAQGPTLPSLSTPPAEAAANSQALASSFRDLQEQVRSLTSELNQVREEQNSARAEALALRDELLQIKSRLAEQTSAAPATAVAAYSSSGPLSAASENASAAAQAAPQQSTERRIAALEESQELAAANLAELSQTKVESGSKYRLRISGIVLLNMFENRGTVDNLDVPEVALPRQSLTSGGAFGGTLRQSQVGLEAFGPDIAGARTSANVTVDFGGGFLAAPNGASKPLVRLRTGSVRLDWANTSIVMGQDSLFFVPLTPSSLASLAVPALAYAGDLWSWTPQVRVEHRIPLAGGSHLLWQGGILDSLSGDVAAAGYERYPTWGERSGQPAYASRVAWVHPAADENFTLGAGGYYGRQEWRYGRGIDGWAATLDMNLPLGKFFELSAAFYRGRAVGGLGGGIGQSILTTASFGNSAPIVRGLDSLGGWAQLKFKLGPKFEVNGALGEDNPFAGELKRFPSSPAYYGIMLTRNVSPFVNFIYQLRSDVLFSAEYRRLETFVLNSNSQRANLVSLSLGYTF
jgi:hypothetical protein